MLSPHHTRPPSLEVPRPGRGGSPSQSLTLLPPAVVGTVYLSRKDCQPRPSPGTKALPPADSLGFTDGPRWWNPRLQRDWLSGVDSQESISYPQPDLSPALYSPSFNPPTNIFTHKEPEAQRGCLAHLRSHSRVGRSLCPPQGRAGQGTGGVWAALRPQGGRHCSVSSVGGLSGEGLGVEAWVISFCRPL